MPKPASPPKRKKIPSPPVTTELLTLARQQLQSWLPREATSKSVLDQLSADIDAATTRGASHRDVVELLASIGLKVSIHTFRIWHRARTGELT